MKKWFNVVIDIDTDREAPEGSGVAYEYSDGSWDIKVNKGFPGENNLYKQDVLATLVHELGHMVAGTFLLPASIQDPRMSFYTANKQTRKIMGLPEPMFPAFPEKDTVIQAEVEAWDIGEKIIKECRASALMSYILYYPQEGEKK